MTLDLDALEAVARAATPGPWHQGAHYIGAGGEPHDPEAVVGQAPILCDAEHIAAFDPPTVRALITRLREAERHNVQLLREAVKREGRVRRAEGAIAEALNHDPLHGRKEGMHCGGMAPCIRDALTAYKPTNQEGNTER